jgi:hypothetical protein
MDMNLMPRADRPDPAEPWLVALVLTGLLAAAAASQVVWQLMTGGWS